MPLGRWRPYFQRGIPSFLSRLEHPKPDHQSLWWTFPLAPPSPPPAPPLAQGPTAGRFQGPRHLEGGVQGQRAQFLPPLALAPVAPLTPPRPPGPSLAPPGPPWAPPGPTGPAPPGPPWPGTKKSACPSLRPRQRWELRAPALNPKR